MFARHRHAQQQRRRMRESSIFVVYYLKKGIIHKTNPSYIYLGQSLGNLVHTSQPCMFTTTPAPITPQRLLACNATECNTAQQLPYPSTPPPTPTKPWVRGVLILPRGKRGEKERKKEGKKCVLSGKRRKGKLLAFEYPRHGEEEFSLCLRNFSLLLL